MQWKKLYIRALSTWKTVLGKSTNMRMFQILLQIMETVTLPVLVSTSAWTSSIKSIRYDNIYIKIEKSSWVRSIVFSII
jgi:hypothetical protein